MSVQRRHVLVCCALMWSAVSIGAHVGAGRGQSPPNSVKDVDGQPRDLFHPAGKASALVFVMSDCPMSNGYAPEIQRICSDYRGKGAACTLVYEDPSIEIAAVRAHRDEYRYRDMPAVIDRDHSIAHRVKATVTPQAIVLDATGGVRYRGRIDNQYAALGKPRQVVTAHDLRDAIDAVLAGRPAPHAETEALGCFITGQKTP